MINTKRLPTRQAIIEAAFDVLNRNTGASLAEIALGAGVGRATLHRHFSSRDDLLRTLAHIAIEEMDEATHEACQGVDSHSDAMRKCLEALIPLGNRHGFIAREPVDEDEALSAEYARLDRETIEMIEGAKAEGLFSPGTPTSWIARIYDHLLYAAWDSVRTDEATPSQAADLAWTTLTRGLETRPNDE